MIYSFIACIRDEFLGFPHSLKKFLWVIFIACAPVPRSEPNARHVVDPIEDNISYMWIFLEAPATATTTTLMKPGTFLDIIYGNFPGDVVKDSTAAVPGFSTYIIYRSAADLE